MVMNYLFVYLMPSLIGLKIYDTLVEKKSNKSLCFSYLTMVFFSNFMLMIILAIKNKFALSLSEYIEGNMMFSIKYILMSLVINILLGYVYSLLNKNLSFKLERVNNEKEEK